ncbi:TonB-dependent receptor [Nordella sp. HKS 07]|uniref:OmpP1/FadL family transporter n=1 Tax=Nordella sp. HKS 07 TaxID=2712222 RepID=UPI0013E173FB|nr:outer membrane protein transport protein [Nordella sp. HKS 07]QIG48386.1 TonB-dependent receptor [Nordella sp. HKS 07]
MYVLLFASTVMTTTSMAATAAAGGFAVRAQSAYGEGSSFAGMAAPEHSISSLFWNPAAATIVTGITVEGNLAVVFPNSELDVDPTLSTLTTLGITGTGGDVGETGIVPTTYFATPLTDKVYLGVSVTAPFGLASSSNEPWVGMFSHLEADALSLNVSPILGIKLNDMFSIAFGTQIQYFEIDIKTALAPTASPPRQRLEGDDVGVGFVAGVTYTPLDGTIVGIGYRSKLKYSLQGSQSFDIPIVTSIGAIPAGTFPVSAEVTLPESISIGVRQRVNETFTVMAGMEWTNWSRMQIVPLKGSPAGSSLTFNYEDGWIFSLGADYNINNDLTFRAGLSYEITPTIDQARSMRLPDADRIWASVGASYKCDERLSIDVGYTHLFVEDAPVDETTFGIRYAGTSQGSVDTISVGLRYRLP